MPHGTGVVSPGDRLESTVVPITVRGASGRGDRDCDFRAASLEPERLSSWYRGVEHVVVVEARSGCRHPDLRSLDVRHSDRFHRAWLLGGEPQPGHGT